MERLMAILKASFTKDPNGAKASIRYISHRPNDRGTRVSRQLFSADGVMTRDEAYSLIDQAGKGSAFFRFVISPDPKSEDSLRDLYLRLVAEETMAELSEQLATPVSWVGAIHDDHSPHRHIHVVAVVQERVERSDLQQLREQATLVCQVQRTERDRGYRQQREREEAVWEFQR